jgi:hypothetical protein
MFEDFLLVDLAAGTPTPAAFFFGCHWAAAASRSCLA